MPKVKPFQNPLKLAHRPSDANGPSDTNGPPVANGRSSSTIPTLPHGQENFPDTSNTPTMIADEVPQQEQAPTQPTNSSATSARNVDRESTKYWKVETIDPNRAIKLIKIKVNEVNNLPIGERIIVDFDNYNAPYGEAQGVLAGYCGLLAIDGNLFPINFDRWSGPLGIPNKFKEDCFETMLKSRFLFRTANAIAYKYCNTSLNKKWATHRQRLWNEFFDPAKSRNELLSNVPMGISRGQWAGFVAYRLKPSTLELCRKNKEIRSQQKIPHTCGSKANSRRRHELYLQTGQYPSRGKLYIETHKRKNESFVNDDARAIAEQIELNMAQSDINEFEVSPHDAVGKVFGEEHSGRVRCMGMGATPSNTFRNTTRRLNGFNFSSPNLDASSTTSTYMHQKISRLESQLNNTLTALKTYMISKEGSVPEEFAGLFAPQSQAVDEEGEPTLVDIVGESAGNNNANCQADI